METERTVRSGEYTKVITADEKGSGGAHHEYMVLRRADEEDADSSLLQAINFQNGPIQEHGVNGVQNEDLLAIVIDRLQCFQLGDFACEENQVALEACRDAIEVLHKRTAGRKARGVEGISEK